MKLPDPVQVLDLFPEERTALLQLLSTLTPEEWQQPTVCAGWSVKDVALHVLGGDLGNLSRRRDGFRGTEPRPGEDIVTLVNRINEEWVQTARRFSTRVITDLLALTGPQLHAYFASLDLMATGGSVSWAGLDKAPVWLDVAREYTERWLHQQHIRDAVGKPGLTDSRYLAPVLATFAYALPPALREEDAPEGTVVLVRIEGEAGGDWSVVREGGRWTLYEGAAEQAAAFVTMDQSTAWRLLTKGITPEEASRSISFAGDRRLGEQVLQAVAIIA